MHIDLNASEALAGFCGWLTTRRKITKMGATEDSAAIAELIKQYSDANFLPPVTKNYPHNLNIPKEQL